MTPANPVEGTTLSGRFTLNERIAVGGMGEVWTATDTVLDRTVAVKLLHPGLSQETDFVERFRAEARHTASLHHPNIATVFDFGEDDGTAYLVMELVPGQPLSQIIAERAPLSAPETASILAQAATALEAAHQGGVIHRDVKPANILITPDGAAKLTDFGISRIIDSAPLTQTGQVLGTAQYLSPEQALGRGATAASDIYALGVVGYEMLTGQRPFEGETVVATALAHVNQPAPTLPDTVPTGVRDVIHACLAKDPAERPASAAAVAQALGMPGSALASDDQSGAASGVPAADVPASARSMPSATQAMAAAGMAAAAPTQAMPAQTPPTQVMPAQAPPTQPPGIPDRRADGARSRPVLLLAAAGVVATLGIVTAVALTGNDAAGPKAPEATSTTTSTSSAPTPRATTAVAPPVSTSPPTKPAQGNGGNSGKKKGK